MTPEQEAEALFNQHFDAIAAAKQRTGDWEQAYQLVTGKAWPTGKNVEIAGGQGQMIDDLPWWRDALKYAGPVAGVAAAPFTGGLTAALIGAGAGAAGSAASGGGVGDALKWAGLGAGAGYGADKLFGLGGKGATDQAGGYIGDAVKGTADAVGGVGGGAGTLASIGNALKSVGVPLGVAAAGKAFAGGGGGGAVGAGSVPPEMQELLKMSMDRMRSQQPLFEAVSRQALAGLPTYAKGGQ
jgi:hypothetical protein